MVIFVISALGLILAVFVLEQQIAFWQRKEYRVDRVLAELSLLYRRPTLLWLVAGLVLIGLFVESVAWLGLTAVTIFYAYQTITRGIFKPRLTPKALVITALSAVLLVLLFFTRATTDYSLDRVWLLLIVLTPVVAAIAVGVGNLVGSIQKRRLIKKASGHRRALTKLKVIGITGSYGKTSTKYFTHHVLTSNSSKAIVMSAAHRNEAFVIAQDMLKNITDSTQVYIAEMAAYRPHEIERTAQLVQPQIGVVTAIRNQHLALFGSLEQLAQAKWELIRSLPQDGVAVLNADDVEIQKQAKIFSGPTIWYSIERPADVYVSDSTIQPTSFSATFHVKSESRQLTIPLAGEGYIASTAAAAAAASAAGASAAHIFDRLQTLKPIPQTMEIQLNGRGATIIDDSYSANEDGVLMALQHLGRFPHKHKVVVLRPLIELGSDTKRVHEVIGQAIATSGAELFLYDVAGAKDIEQAAKQAGLAAPIHRLAAPKALAEALSLTLTPDTVCLLENRLPSIVRQAALA